MRGRYSRGWLAYYLAAVVWATVGFVNEWGDGVWPLLWAPQIGLFFYLALREWDQRQTVSVSINGVDLEQIKAELREAR